MKPGLPVGIFEMMIELK